MMMPGRTQTRFTPDPGVVPTSEPVFCGLCGELATEERGVNGPRSYAQAMAGGGSLHDVFECPFREVKWHVKAMALLSEYSSQRSAMVAMALLGEAQEVLDREREKLVRSYAETPMTSEMLELAGWDARGLGAYVLVDSGDETAAIELLLSPQPIEKDGDPETFSVSVLQDGDHVAFPRGDVKTLLDYRRLILFVRTWLGKPLLRPKGPVEERVLLASTNCRQ